MFKDTSDDLLQMDENMLSSDASEKSRPKKAKVKEGKRRSSSSKDFTDDLQSFLQEAFQESFEKQMAQESKPLPSDLEIKKRSKKPVGGLDALIRNTIEPEKVEFKGNSIKQLTLTFDEEKIKKLKKIARTEKKYLRKVINDIVEEYIKQYEQQKGKIE